MIAFQNCFLVTFFRYVKILNCVKIILIWEVFQVIIKSNAWFFYVPQCFNGLFITPEIYLKLLLPCKKIHIFLNLRKDNILNQNIQLSLRVTRDSEKHSFSLKTPESNIFLHFNKAFFRTTFLLKHTYTQK